MNKSSSLYSNQHAAILHTTQHRAVACIIEQLSKSAVIVGGLTNEFLQHIAINEPTRIQITTDLPQPLIVTATVEKISASRARLKYSEPLDNSIQKLERWFNAPQNTSTSLNSQQIIDQLNQITSQHLSKLFDTFVTKAESGLLNMAEKAENNDRQNKLFEALAQLKQNSTDIKQRGYEILINNTEQNSIEHARTQQAPKPTTAEQLELIDQAQFEDWLSLEVIIRRANEHYYQPLECLAKRYSQLLGREFEKKQLPASVNTICTALQQTFKHFGFEPELLPVVYRFFDEAVIGQLDTLYETLNSTLEHHGVLPDIDLHPLSTNRLIKSNTNQTLQQLEQTAANEAVTEQSTALSSVTPRLMDAVKKFQHLLQHSNPVSIDNIDDQHPVPITELVDHLTQLQQDPNAIDTLVKHLSLQRELAINHKLTVSTNTADIMSLVESIFQTLDTYSHIANSLLNAIKRLQLPITKVALLDPGFFTRTDHPARQLLNKMIDLSLNSDIPNTPLEQQFTQLIDDINKRFDQNDSVFEQACVALQATAQQQAKTYSRNTQRVIQTYEGKQQLKQATDAVELEINKRIKPPDAPQVVVDLSENGWRELLKLTYLKAGPNSEDWHKHLDCLDQLILWTDTVDDRQAIDVDYQHIDDFVDTIEEQLNNAFPGDYRYRDTIDQIRETLKGIRAPTRITVTPTLGKLTLMTQEVASRKPEHARWLKRATKVQVGNEFSYIGDNSGKKNIKLVWISTDKQHFVFVNNRGQKVLDYDLLDLANEFSSGLIPVEKQSELPLVERSLYSTIQHAYETLAFRSSHDELTGLLSRKECEKILASTITDAKNSNQYHCLLYIDIDQFSLINALHGHVAGDQQLVEISKIILASLPEETIAARMAGNEFVVLLKNQDGQQYLKTCEDLRCAIEKHTFEWQEHRINLTASIGVVIINQFTKSVIDLIRDAIEACQTAKQNGGNRFYDFRQDSELHTRREKLLLWIDKLDHLLTSDKLVLRGQAIAPAFSTPLESHYEILLALKDNQGKLMSPVEFIEAAESFSRMQKVDRWVIDKAFQWLQTIDSGQSKTPSISINLSGNSLNDDTFTDFLLDKFEQYTIPTNKVCFEVTETATINNIAEVADFIREIKNIGCKFALDDFGSGNASYQYLRHLPVDYIKIDGMFVQEIDKNPDDFALVKSINEIAHLMGKETVAEYAESQSIIDKLKEIGVDYLQGYAISTPLLLDKIKLQAHSEHQPK